MQVLSQAKDSEDTLKKAREAESTLLTKVRQSLTQQLAMITANRSNTYLLLDIPGLDSQDTQGLFDRTLSRVESLPGLPPGDISDSL